VPVENLNVVESGSLPARTSAARWDPLVSAIAYFTFIPGAIFLLTGSFRKSRLVRFHSLQSILLWVALVLAAVAVRVIFLALSMVPSMAFLIGWIAAFVVGLAFFLLWVVLTIKALQGEMFELPLLGKIATKQST
jgi:uncharacterized membrane protein